MFAWTPAQFNISPGGEVHNVQGLWVSGKFFSTLGVEPALGRLLAPEDDQSRLRENMKALKGSAEEKALLERYTKQLNGQEDRLAELQKEIKEQRMKRAALQSQLDAMVEAMALDETL